ncbi:hypothetical protein K9M16_03820 [Candidatus Babeliales bacterium]|nr:hypothetical protein [Candidatus Babeliales bacterium]
MKKLLKGLLLTACMVGTAGAATNKTFLLPRSHGVNKAMEYTTWNELINMDKEDRFGANFQVIGFYQGSTNDATRGKYFGVNDKNNFTFGDGTTRDVNAQYIIHNYNATDDLATLNIKAEQQAAGAKIFYYQDLEKLIKGLYLKANLPIVWVSNDTNFGASSVSGTVFGTANTNVLNYFKGTYAAPAANNYQEALTKSKINGSQSKTGVADIDIVLGYKFLDKADYHLSINLGFTIPTGTKASGTYLWEPIVGNGQHWAFGGGLDFGATLWEKNDQNIKFELALDYRYVFENSEIRPINFKSGTITGLSANWNHYYLVGKVGEYAKPAANITTLRVNVEPGSQLDGIAAFRYNNGGFNIELGYNLFWKDSESVKSKDTLASAYGLIVTTADLDSGTILDTAVANWYDADGVAATWTSGDAKQLANSDLDFQGAASESQLTNKIYGGVGYIFKNWEYPMMLGLAGHYEFASRSGVENWGLWGKIGVGF